MTDELIWTDEEEQMRLHKLAEKNREAFHSAQPFPNVAIDDFLPSAMACALRDHYPPPQEMDQKTYQNYERRIAVSPCNSGFPAELLPAFFYMMSAPLLDFLEELTGISSLIPDPRFYGAGLVDTLRGGKLDIHLDFTIHKHLSIYRRLNLILYLNDDWKEEYGGCIELWDRDMKGCVQRIAPDFNRAVIFETSDHSYHGYPDPIQCPKGMSRKAANFYFYTATPDERMNEQIDWTTYADRPGARQEKFWRPLEKALYKVTPPIVSSVVRKMFIRSSR